jgi:transcriptional regulator with XRE-family HTH domain
MLLTDDNFITHNLKVNILSANVSIYETVPNIHLYWVIMMYYIGFGEILRDIRKEKGLSQSELGKLIGTSKAVISKYENSMSYPSYDVLIRIASTFKVSTDYLLGVEKKKTINSDGLTNKQIDSIITIATEYQKLNSQK